MEDKIAFDLPDLSYEEYRNQEIITVDDGVFFDSLDKLFGIENEEDE